jgi:murein hydrolase activator
MERSFLIYAFLFALCTGTFAVPDMKQLESRMSAYQKEIETTNNLLKQTEANRKKTAGYLSLLDRKIRLRNSMIAELDKEVAILSSIIDNNHNQIAILKDEIEAIKREYAQLIRYANQNRSSYSRLMYIIASDDFNTAYKRLLYFQQYSQYRKRQVDLLMQKQDTLQSVIEQTQENIIHKNLLASQQREENSKLLTEKEEKRAVVTNLSKRERELMAELKTKRQAADKLNKEIQELIALEIKRRKEQEKLKQTPQDPVLSKNFAENIGKLIWPIERGVITGRFGEQPHPVLRNITVINNGIDIATTKNAPVRAIFDGVVSKVILIPGSHAAIIIRHGDFLTVYSNVVDTRVKAGQQVNAKQTIGTVYTDNETGQSVVQLQIWKETTKLNPELWLAKM